MRFRIVLFAYLLLFHAFVVSAMGAEAFLVSGTVHDGTGALIPGATVSLRGSDGAEIGSTQTDAEGLFRVVAPAAGSYQVEVQAAGFLAYKAPVALNLDAPTANVDVALAVEGNSLTVEVTANALAAETTSTQLGESLDTKKIEACR